MQQAMSALPAPWARASARPAKPARGATRLHAVRAASSNGSGPGLETAQLAGADQHPVEMLEMVVADDLMRPLSSGDQQARGRAPTKRLVPAPHKAAPAVPARTPAAKPAAAAAANGVAAEPGALNGIVSTSGRNGAGLVPANGLPNGAALNGSGANGAGTGLLPPMVQQMMAMQSTNKLVSGELVSAQRKVTEQQLEIKSLRGELSAREAEVSSLRQELAEKDGKLKAARTDALESKMRLQQKDSELKEAYAQLSEAVRDRSAMRSQLAQTHAELAETRAELEQLADDILAIKLLMDDDDDNSFGHNQEAYAAAAALADGPSGNGAGADDDTLDVLHSLAALSRQLAADAAEDDAIVQSLGQPNGWDADANRAAMH